MADFFESQANSQNLGLLGGALKGFAQGMMQAEDYTDRKEDRKLKRLEFEAKLKSEAEKKEREAAEKEAEKAWKERQLRADMRKGGFLVSPDGQDFDPGSAKYDPEYIKMKTDMAAAQAAASSGLAGPKAVDTNFAKDYADYQAGGGKATVEKNLGLLESAIADLKRPGELGGGVSSLAGDAAQDYINPESAIVRDKIRSAIQTSLRQLMGPQFTEKEGTAIFNRAYNPRLSDDENVRRAEAELQGLRKMAEQKEASARYFEKYGTLRGFRPDSLAVESSGGLLGNQNNGMVPKKSQEEIDRARLEELRRKARGG